MRETISKFAQTQAGACLRFFLPLGLACALIAALMSSLGCSYYPSYGDFPAAEGKISIQSELPEGYSGERVRRTLSAIDPAGAGAMLHAIDWTPPEGATDVRFLGRQPEPGGPPYTFKNVPSGEKIVFFYNLPKVEAWQNPLQATEKVSVWFSNVWIYQASQLKTTVHPFPRTSLLQERTTDGRVSQAEPGALEAAAPMSGTIKGWEVDFMINGTFTLTTQSCQDLMDFMARDDVFMALQAPFSATLPTQGQPLPLVMGDTAQYMILYTQYHGPFTEVITAPLTLRSRQTTFAESALPAVEGKGWVTLGVSGTHTCPAGLNIPPGAPGISNWGVILVHKLDLSSQPGNCAGCTLDVHYCSGAPDEPPLGSFSSYDDWGIRCTGPSRVQLEDQATINWMLEGAGEVEAQKGQELKLRHLIAPQRAGMSLAMNVDYASTLPASWKIYLGDGNAPNLAQPAVFPLNVTAPTFLWWVATLPADTPAGSYSLIVTAATQSAGAAPLSMKVSDLIWVKGAWTPPPLTLPAIPALQSPRAGSTHIPELGLRWKVGECLQGRPCGPQERFEVQLDGRILTTTNTYSPTVLAAGQHTWTARAWNSDGYSAWAPQAAFTVTTTVPDEVTVARDDLRAADLYRFDETCAVLTFARTADLGGLRAVTVTLEHAFPPRIWLAPLPRLYTIQGNVNGGFSAMLSLCYTDVDLQMANITDETQLQIYHYDPQSGRWVAHPDSIVDASAQVVAAPIQEFGLWAIGAPGSPPKMIYLPLVVRSWNR